MRFDEANALQRALRRLAGRPSISWVLARVMHRLDAPVLAATRGRHTFTSLLTGLPVVELTTVGARSGLPRTSPIIGVPDGGRLILIASNYGQVRHPGWYHNLLANPRCSVVLRGQRLDMTAYEAEGEERTRMWQLDQSVYPAREQYLARAGDRRIPVMVLQQVDASAS